MRSSPKTENALAIVGRAGTRGLTGSELAAEQPGNATAMLSRLHYGGEVVRLQERRGKAWVYVLPEYVSGQAKAPADAPRVIPMPVEHAVDVDALMAALEAVSELQRVAERVELEAAFLAQAEDFAQQLDDLAEQVRASQAAAAKMKLDTANRLGQQTRKHKAELGERTAEALDDGEAKGWQLGYDEGVKRGQASVHGGDTFYEGRMQGRLEGEELLRKRVANVGGELHKVITLHAPIRGHFQGCYTLHPECAVRALMRSAGITTRPMGLSQAG